MHYLLHFSRYFNVICGVFFLKFFVSLIVYPIQIVLCKTSHSLLKCLLD